MRLSPNGLRTPTLPPTQIIKHLFDCPGQKTLYDESGQFSTDTLTIKDFVQLEKRMSLS